ncbi:putative bifunctional diguanylate cyclase/phosphodiesterase [Aquidulcibacter paucihalophilus]|uniref:putative bifunctional diguanylate cyclase/phosphodiesterase n=1 Tax=Aquidulcibacter paucihalophilus TaxID=1978549 RepID=UPI000A19ACED|nr:EAL domain-containing protein [Aquidulcibacter paucihalophilus]
MAFKRLKTRLTVTYGGLFVVVLALLVAATCWAVINYATLTVQREMSATSSVFQRIWAIQSETQRTSADLLSRDFGFKTAIAKADQATLRSAFENLKGRVAVDDGLVIDLNGSLLVGANSPIANQVASIVAQDYPVETFAGIQTIKGQAFSVVVAPVLAPDPIAWVVFASALNQDEMGKLEALSSIPLRAALISKRGNGVWMNASGAESALDPIALEELVLDKAGRATIEDGPHGQQIVVATQLPALGQDEVTALILTYPLALALANYQPLVLALIGLGIVAVLVLGFASREIARGITQPVFRLKQAVNSLQSGDRMLVDIQSKDELGDLGQAFNQMATSIREREARILYMARHDLPTGLPNRAAFEEAVHDLMQAERPVLLVAAGMESFDHIRSVWGVEASHQLIAGLGERLRHTGQDWHIARLSPSVIGIAIGLPDRGIGHDPTSIPLDQIATALATAIVVDNKSFEVTPALGFDLATDPSISASDWIERSLIALDQAQVAKLALMRFDPRTYDQLADNLKLTDQLREALDHGDLQAFYQPKFNYRTGQVTSVEALVRWQHAERGWVSPQAFVLIAEETGLIRELTEQVLRAAVADQKRLHGLGYDVCISVNYSGRLLNDPEFCQTALALCAEVPNRICLEITETAVINDPVTGVQAIKRFVDAGVEISIDDFGTGLSSLSYLKQIPAQELKIDRSFVVAMTDGNRERRLVRSIIEMGHGLGMKVTAEGVEDQAAIALLGSMGCDMAQGYGIAKPMPADQLLAFLAKPLSMDLTLDLEKKIA